MGASILKQMTWQEAKAFIDSRLNRLAMCKRGSLETDIQSQKKALGNQPRFTAAEEAVIMDNLADTIAKKCKVTKSLAKKCKSDPHAIGNEITRKVSEITKKAYVHPDLAEWKEAREKIDEQHRAREATLDGDFRDCLDDFILGNKEIGEFPQEYNKMEAREW